MPLGKPHSRVLPFTLLIPLGLTLTSSASQPPPAPPPSGRVKGDESSTRSKPAPKPTDQPAPKGVAKPVTARPAVMPPKEPPRNIEDLHALVEWKNGSLPIIITAPHGGDLPIPDCPARTGEGLEKGPGKWVTARDTGSDLLARAVADELAKRLKGSPHLVVARWHRKFADANRPPELGVEHPLARVVHDRFHDRVIHACRTVRERYGRGLLLDFHGQGSAKDTVFRGTQNGKTVTLLRQRFGPAAHVGPESFFGLLDRHGVKGFPLDEAKERAGFTGGHIVQTYGSHETFGIDAIQLEFGGDHRRKERIAEWAPKLADAITEFAKRYLPDQPLPEPGPKTS